MPSPNKNKRTAPASPASWPEKSPCISKADFGIGSYVMALWRNKFEYLAEVLAFRNRSREHPEYRLKFVWDRVVEWTPASRIRKATQAEISYVLKFVRRYGDARSGTKGPAPVPENKQATKQNCKGPTQEAEALSHAHPTRSKNLPDATSPATAAKTPPQTATTQSFGGKQATKSDSKRKSTAAAAVPADSKVSTAAGGSGAGSSTKSVAARDAISMEGTVAHGDMLYDKSIAQFHEACRKRRELKRRAIDSDVPTTTTQQERQISSTVDVKPPTAKKSSVLTRDIKSEDPSPGQNGDVLAAAAVAPGLSPLPLSPPPQLVKNISAVGIASDDVKPPSKIPPSPISPTTASAEEASPVAFQCPHCPRKLRRYSLLTAHICNYHRDDLTSKNGGGVGCDNNNADHQSPLSPLSAEASDARRHHLPIQQASPLSRSCTKREAARSSQTQARLPTVAASVPATEVVGAAQSGVKKQEAPAQKEEEEEHKVKITEEKTQPLLVFCPVCKFSGPSKERQENLLRCLICRVWCHRRCLISSQRQQLDEKPNPEFDNWICESCATVPPHMPSSYRLREVSRGWSTRCLSARDNSPAEGATTQRRLLHRRNLFSEALSLVNWLHQMQPMLLRGRQAMQRLRSAVPASSAASSKPAAADRNATELRADNNNNGGDSGARSLLQEQQRFNNGGGNRHDDPSAAEAGLNFGVGMDISEADFMSGAGSDDGISALLMNLPDMNLDALVQEDGDGDAAASLLAKKSLDFCQEEEDRPSAGYLTTLPRRSSADDPLTLSSVSADISRLIDNLGPDYLLGAAGLPYPPGGGDLVDGSGGGQEGMDELWKRPPLPSSFLCCTSSAGTSAAGTPADTPAALLAGGSGTAAGSCCSISPFDTPTKALYAAALSVAEEMPVFAPAAVATQEMEGRNGAEEQIQVANRPHGDTTHIGGGGNAEAQQLDFLSAVSAVPRSTEKGNSDDDQAPLPVDMLPTPAADPSWIEAQTQSSATARALSKEEPSQDEPNGLTPVTCSSAALPPSLPSPTKLNRTFLPQRKPQPPLVESVRDLVEVATPESSGLSYYASSAGLEHENPPAINKLETSPPSSSSLTPIKFESLNCTPEKLLPISWVSEYHQHRQQQQQHTPAPPKPSPMKTASAPPLTDLESLEVEVVGPLEQMIDAIEQHLNALESEVRRLEEQEKEEDAKQQRCHLAGVFQPTAAVQQPNDLLIDGGGGDSSCRFSSAASSSCSSLSSSLTSPSRALVGGAATSLSTSTSSSSCSSPSHPARDRSSTSAVDSRLGTVGAFRRQPPASATVRGRDFPPLRRSSATDVVHQDRRRADNRRRPPSSSSRPFPPLGGSALERPYGRTPTSNGQQQQQQQGRLRQMYGDTTRRPTGGGWQPRPGGNAWHTTNNRYHHR